jgi:hypothetical protein
MKIKFKPHFMQAFDQQGQSLILDSRIYDYSFIIESKRYPEKNPVTMGQALSVFHDAIHELCDNGKFKEASLFSRTNILKWLSENNMHLEITENDYIILNDASNAVA